MQSEIDPKLIEAYLETDYIILDDPPLLLKIGEQNDDLRILLASFSVASAAFITAWNPHSGPLSEEENDDRQANLLHEIEMQRLNYIVGVGERLDWQEYSYLVLGISKETAQDLGTRFEQNAFVWIDDTGIPELVTLR